MGGGGEQTHGAVPRRWETEAPQSCCIRLCSPGRVWPRRGPREAQAHQGSPRHGAREPEQVQGRYSVLEATARDSLSTRRDRGFPPSHVRLPQCQEPRRFPVAVLILKSSSLTAVCAALRSRLWADHAACVGPGGGVTRLRPRPRAPPVSTQEGLLSPRAVRFHPVPDLCLV